MKKNSLMTGLVLALFMFAPSFAQAANPLALVWAGAGACKPGCVKGAAKVANRAGFDVQYIYEGFQDYSVFDRAKLWIQPGGHSVNEAEAMGPALLQHVQDFVANGGGYMGFCAGAFLSTAVIGTTDVNGYGFVPGGTELLIQSGSDHKMLEVQTPNGSEWMYYAGGPYFKITDDQLKAVDGQVIGRYPDNSVAAVQVHYGKGRVAVAGFHPEASFFWKLIKFKIDHDGSDIDYAVSMAKFAGGIE